MFLCVYICICVCYNMPVSLQNVFSINVGSGALGLQDKLYEVTTNVISVFISIAYHLNQCNGNFLNSRCSAQHPQTQWEQNRKQSGASVPLTHIVTVARKCLVSRDDTRHFWSRPDEKHDSSGRDANCISRC